MGLGIMRWSASHARQKHQRDAGFYGASASAKVTTIGDPQPERFEIMRVIEHRPYIVAEVRWPDAKNYEGKKVLLYKATEAELRAARSLDPHFQEQRGPLVPIARFEPTERGWEAARVLASHFAILGEP